MYLPIEKAETVLNLLLEGNSISSVERVTGTHHTTILRLLTLAGEKCERIMAEKIRNVEVRDVEADEVWAYIGKKQKRVRPEDDQNLGDCYTFVAIERHTKLVLNITMGKRDQQTANVFVEGIRHATSRKRFQITTDGFAPYRYAIPDTLGDRCDFAMLIKVYRAASEGEGRYSPAEVQSVEVVPVMGNPTPTVSVRRLWSVPISASGWAFAALPGSRTLSVRSGRTTGQPCPCGTHSTIFAASTNRFA